MKLKTNEQRADDALKNIRIHLNSFIQEAKACEQIQLNASAVKELQHIDFYLTTYEKKQTKEQQEKCFREGLNDIGL